MVFEFWKEKPGCRVESQSFPVIPFPQGVDGNATDAPEVCMEEETLHAGTATVFQLVVFGLTVTEWMAKLREEVMTYDLIGAMAADFFVAFDIIEFLMLPASEPEIFSSGWLDTCFIFTWIAMFLYVPTTPVSIEGSGSAMGEAVAIVVTLLCIDIPFAIIRLTTLFLFGFEASDFIYPVKNIGMICFGSVQLYFLWHNGQKEAKEDKEKRFTQKRISRFPGAWGDLTAVFEDLEHTNNVTSGDNATSEAAEPKGRDED